jgi:3-keto-disaccharide hydrolase
MRFKSAAMILLSLASAMAPSVQAAVPAGWYALFDGKTLSDWENRGAGDWRMTTVGVVKGEGKYSVLLSPQSYTNFEFKAQVTLNADGNSGVYFRATPTGTLKQGGAQGYEAQLSNSDPQKTGSLYNFVVIKERLVPENAWFRIHIAAAGNRIIIRLNEKTVVDYIDKKNTYQAGRIGFQQHHVGSSVMFRNAIIRPLPLDPHAALVALQSSIPGLPSQPK